jgi:hypothetical protein
MKMTPTPTTTLHPRWAVPVTLFICAFIVGWPAFALLEFGPARQLWWAIAVLSTIAAGFLYGSAHGFVTRGQWRIEVFDDAFEVFGHRIERDQVRRVARYVDPMFRGVRIELEGGGWIKIPVHMHRPRKLLAAFKRHGYPVWDKR